MKKVNPQEWMRKIGVPEDVLFNTPILEMQEFNYIHIINYTQIAELASDKIQISTTHGTYVIEGKRLCVSKATNREIEVQGKISLLKFVEIHERKER